MSPLGQSRLHATALLLAAPALAALSGDPRTASGLLAAALTGAPTVAPADPTAPLLAALALAAWACAGWLLLVALLTGLGRVHGGVGKAAHRLGSWVAPASVRAVVGLAVGVTLTGTVLAGPAFASEPAPAPSAPIAAADPATSPAAPPSLDWPTSPTGTATPGTARPTGAVPSAVPVYGSTDVPTAGAPAASGSVQAVPVWSTPPLPAELTGAEGSFGTRGSDVPPRTVGSAPAVDAPGLPRDAVPGLAAVVVQPGDSLWAIAARDLGPAATPTRIAQAWPQWWQANRAVLGADPDLIHPGASLTDPTR